MTSRNKTENTIIFIALKELRKNLPPEVRPEDIDRLLKRLEYRVVRPEKPKSPVAIKDLREEARDLVRELKLVQNEGRRDELQAKLDAIRAEILKLEP